VSGAWVGKREEPQILTH